MVKRDDAIAFAFGGNKVRKMQLVAAQAQAAGADTLITTGARPVQPCPSHRGGRREDGDAMHSGRQWRPVQSQPTANALLDQLLGAEVRYVGTRDERDPEMERAADGRPARGGIAVRHSAWSVDAAWCRRIRRGDRGARDAN